MIYEQKLDQNHWFPHTNTTEISLLSLTCDANFFDLKWESEKNKIELEKKEKEKKTMQRKQHKT